MLLKFAPLMLKNSHCSRRSVTTSARSLRPVAELFESRSVLSASAASAMADCATEELQGDDWMYDEALDGEDPLSPSANVAVDHSEASGSDDWTCNDSFDGLAADEFAPFEDDVALPTDDCAANSLDYAMTTDADDELYSGSVVALTGNIDEIATDEFLFELDDYLMERFGGGEDFELSDDIVEFYVVDGATLSDMNSDGAINASDYLATADAYGLTGFDAAFDFLVVRNSDGFEVVDIPYSVTTLESEVPSNVYGSFDTSTDPNAAASDSLTGTAIDDSLPSAGSFDANEIADSLQLAEFANTDSLLGDSLAAASSADPLLPLVTTELTADDSSNQSEDVNSRQTLGERIAEALRETSNPNYSFGDRNWKASLPESQQLAAADSMRRSPEIAALIAELVREQRGTEIGDGLFGATNHGRRHELSSDEAEMTSLSTDTNRGPIRSLAQRYDSILSQTVLSGDAEADALSLRDSLKNDSIDSAFGDGANRVLRSLDGSADQQAEVESSLTYSQMASATGVLLIAGAGCVQVGRRNGFWLLWRTMRRAVLAMIRLA